jgi:hypothetical protein
MDFFYSDSVSNCPVCEGSGYRGSEICNCLLKHRAEIWLASGKFSRSVLDFVSCKEYTLPIIDSGGEVLKFYIQNPELVLDEGLSLNLFSRDAGRGKTTLAYYICWNLALHFLRTENYRTGLSFAFQNVNSLISSELSYTSDEFPAWKASVYVLDDLGNEERASKQKKEAVAPILQKVFHYRQDNSLPTIITTNYTPSDLGSLYYNRLDSLLELDVGGEIRGNIFRQIEVGGGEDLRMAPIRSAWPEEL